MAVDIRVNSKFDVDLWDRNDLEVVEGQAAFEQHLAVLLTAYFHELLGEGIGTTNLKNKVELKARRVVREVSDIENAPTVTVEKSTDQPNTLVVSVLYDTGDEFTFEIQ